MLFGAHFSIRQGLLDALGRAESLNCEAIQIFGYRRHEFYFDPKLPDGVREKLDQEIKNWLKALNSSAVKEVIIHARQVAILAANDQATRKKSIQKFIDEVTLAQKLRAHYFVFHLGPYGLGMKLEEGLKSVCEAMGEVFESLSPDGPVVVIENVPGGARRMGAMLEELNFIMKQLEQFKERLGLCLDLAHLWAAGYKIDTKDNMHAFCEFLKKILNPRAVLLFHLNNTRVSLGGHIDEHRHLADGVILPEAFGCLVKMWPNSIGILETPKDSLDADSKNLALLRQL